MVQSGKPPGDSGEDLASYRGQGSLNSDAFSPRYGPFTYHQLQQMSGCGPHEGDAVVRKVALFEWISFAQMENEWKKTCQFSLCD